MATEIPVDGGRLAARPRTNINEISLDIEQAGAIASSATIQAYVTNDTEPGFVDAFEEIAAANTASVVSLSYDFPEIASIIGADTQIASLLSEMALQGQTVSISAGDAGAFAASRNQENNGTASTVFPTLGAAPAYWPVYSIVAYSADPLVTARGGTMLPFTASYNGYEVEVAAEQPWSTSILALSEVEGEAPLSSIVNALEANFPIGGGGGVSITWSVPVYQSGLAGVI